MKLNLPVWACSEQLNFPSKQKFKSSGSFGKKCRRQRNLKLPSKARHKWLPNFLIMASIPFCTNEEFIPQVWFHERHYLLDTLMPLYHCHKPVFRPKMAIFWRAGMREGGLPLPLGFQYLIFMKWRACGLNLVMISLLASKCQDFKFGMPFFQPFYDMKLKTSKSLYHKNKILKC